MSECKSTGRFSVANFDLKLMCNLRPSDLAGTCPKPLWELWGRTAKPALLDESETPGTDFGSVNCGHPQRLRAIHSRVSASKRATTSFRNSLNSSTLARAPGVIEARQTKETMAKQRRESWIGAEVKLSKCLRAIHGP